MKTIELIQLIKTNLFLHEGIMDWLTTQISREIVNYLKGYIQNPNIPTFKFKIENVALFIQFSVNSGIDKPQIKGARFNKPFTTVFIEIAVPEGGIELHHFNEFIPVLKEAIRHELEHYQQNLRNKDIPQTHYATSNAYHADNIKGLSSIKDIEQYYLDPLEVESHVMGAYKLAKTSKIPLASALAMQLQRIYDAILAQTSPKEALEIATKIQSAWTEYAQKRLSK